MVPEQVAVLKGITGAVLAGGAGKRLGGVAKGLVEVDGEPILAKTLTLFGGLFERVILIANDPAPYADLIVDAASDVIEGKGAPGGLHSALHHATTDWVFLVACDMPFLESALIEELARFRSSETDAVVCRWDGRPEPLHALYHQRCNDVLDPALRSGNPSFRDVFSALRVHWLNDDTTARLSRDGRAFRSVNTPEDLAAAGGVLPRRKLY